MIGHLRGVLVHREDASLVVEVGGIGYEVEVTASTLTQLPGNSEPLSLYTHFVVREDVQALYGFSAKSERDMFRALIRISGVGPKLALTLLSGVETLEFARCVRDEDVSSLVKVPGIGRKTAERLLVELKDKMEQWLPDLPPVQQTAAMGNGQVISEAEQALVALGYKPQEASRWVAQVYDPDLSTQELVKQVLKQMLHTPVSAS